MNELEREQHRQKKKFFCWRTQFFRFTEKMVWYGDIITAVHKQVSIED